MSNFTYSLSLSPPFLFLLCASTLFLSDVTVVGVDYLDLIEPLTAKFTTHINPFPHFMDSPNYFSSPLHAIIATAISDAISCKGLK